MDTGQVLAFGKAFPAGTSDPKVEPTSGADPMLPSFEERIVGRGKPGSLFRTMR
jgi:hypothetical protein